MSSMNSRFSLPSTCAENEYSSTLHLRGIMTLSPSPPPLLAAADLDMTAGI